MHTPTHTGARYARARAHFRRKGTRVLSENVISLRFPRATIYTSAKVYKCDTKYVGASPNVIAFHDHDAQPPPLGPPWRDAALLR